MKKLKSFVRKEKSNPNLIDTEDPVFRKKVAEITRAFLDKNPLLTKYRIELSKEQVRDPTKSGTKWNSVAKQTMSFFNF